jgi:hypothetical protein
MWQSEGTTRTAEKNATAGKAARIWQMAYAGHGSIRGIAVGRSHQASRQWLEFIGALEVGRPIAITSTMACGRRGKLKDALAQVPLSRNDG